MCKLLLVLCVCFCEYLFSGIGVVWFMCLVSVFFCIKTDAFLGYDPLLLYELFFFFKTFKR